MMQHWSSTGRGTLFHDGLISGSGTLAKRGTGTLKLQGHNTFTGGTTVEAGTLSINGVIGTVRVMGGTLGGNGTVGDVTVGAGQRLLPAIPSAPCMWRVRRPFRPGRHMWSKWMARANPTGWTQRAG